MEFSLPLHYPDQCPFTMKSLSRSPSITTFSICACGTNDSCPREPIWQVKVRGSSEGATSLRLIEGTNSHAVSSFWTVATQTFHYRGRGERNTVVRPRRGCLPSARVSQRLSSDPSRLLVHRGRSWLGHHETTSETVFRMMRSG